ncbi:sperm acrosome membrane-associated protein 4-like isoform X2 [Silurus meridionalis]|uniref:sperm acrosome membrane-associated protein 4-like isoform X2 n=1 Tax=Silurus meridionalis TaxID=175797 RepID=UPI001EEB1FDC|nr:sperm acrosome membrane-associated protein 4-like isoform X2 [Silurus meridionalis]
MSIISTALLSLILLSLLFSTVVCLSCYECEYPNNPITCVKLTKKCAAGSKVAVLKMKRCAAASMCDVTEKRNIQGLIFRYTTHCCDTNMCNAAVPLDAPYWTKTLLSLVGMALTILLASA